MKKYLYLTLVAIVASVLCCCYGSTDPVKPYPWHRAECWYCAEIDMTIRFTADAQGDRTGSASSQQTIEGEIYEIGIGFQNDAIAFFCDLDNDGVAERILDGTWIYRDGNLVVKVHEDTVFSEQYPELEFVPSE